MDKSLHDKLAYCRSTLCDAQLDLMDFVEGSGYIDPSNTNLLIIYNVIISVINSIDLISDQL